MTTKQLRTVSTAIVLAVGLLGAGAVSAGEGCGCAQEKSDTYNPQSSNEGMCGRPSAPSADVGTTGRPAIGTKITCPVSGNEFAVTKDTPSSVYKGKTYVFFCPYCKAQFDKNPEKYLK